MDFKKTFVLSHHLIRSVPHLLNLINAVAKPLECAPQVLSGLNCHVGISLPTALERQLHVRKKISLKAQDATESFQALWAKNSKISNMYWHWFCVSNFQVQPLSHHRAKQKQEPTRDDDFLASLSLSFHPPFFHYITISQKRTAFLQPLIVL